MGWAGSGCLLESDKGTLSTRFLCVHLHGNCYSAVIAGGETCVFERAARLLAPWRTNAQDGRMDYWVNQQLNNCAMDAHESNDLGLSFAVDVFDQDDLFESLDNESVMMLSRQGGRSGFRDLKSIQKSTGISKRRILAQGITKVDLGIKIIRKLEETAKCKLADFDHILLCHSHVFGNECGDLARQLESHFNLDPRRIAAFNHGCAGYLKMMTEAARLLDGEESGSRVAILSVETPEFWHDSSDRLFCGIVSAGATASVVEVGAGIPLYSIKSDDFRIPESRRPNPDPLFNKDEADGFDFRAAKCHRTVMRMNPEPVFLNGIELMLDNLRSALMAVDYQPGQRIVVAPHQPSAKLLKALAAAAKAEFPELEFLNNLEFYGNTISSSVPTLLSRIHQVVRDNDLPALQEGDTVILLAAGICMKEIADHMSAGHACLTWQPSLLNTVRQQQTVVGTSAIG